MRVPSWSMPLAHWLRNHQLLYARWVRIYEADTSAVSPQRPTVDVEIFEAKDEDIRRLAAMVSSSPEAWLGRQTRGSVCLIARSGTTYRGCLWITRGTHLVREVNHVVNVSRDPSGAYIHIVFIMPDSRRMGIDGDRSEFWDSELRGFIRDRVPDTYYLYPDDFESQERSNDRHDPPAELPPLPGVLPQDGECGRARPLRYRPVLEATRVSQSEPDQDAAGSAVADSPGSAFDASRPPGRPDRRRTLGPTASASARCELPTRAVLCVLREGNPRRPREALDVARGLERGAHRPRRPLAFDSHEDRARVGIARAANGGCDGQEHPHGPKPGGRYVPLRPRRPRLPRREPVHRRPLGLRRVHADPLSPAVRRVHTQSGCHRRGVQLRGVHQVEEDVRRRIEVKPLISGGFIPPSCIGWTRGSPNEHLGGRCPSGRRRARLFRNPAREEEVWPQRLCGRARPRRLRHTPVGRDRGRVVGIPKGPSGGGREGRVLPREVPDRESRPGLGHGRIRRRFNPYLLDRHGHLPPPRRGPPGPHRGPADRDGRRPPTRGPSLALGVRHLHASERPSFQSPDVRPGQPGIVRREDESPRDIPGRGPPRTPGGGSPAPPRAVSGRGDAPGLRRGVRGHLGGP